MQGMFSEDGSISGPHLQEKKTSFRSGKCQPASTLRTEGSTANSRKAHMAMMYSVTGTGHRVVSHMATEVDERQYIRINNKH